VSLVRRGDVGCGTGGSDTWGLLAKEDLKLNLGLSLLRLSQAEALLQTTQAHAEIVFTGSAI